MAEDVVARAVSLAAGGNAAGNPDDIEGYWYESRSNTWLNIDSPTGDPFSFTLDPTVDAATDRPHQRHLPCFHCTVIRIRDRHVDVLVRCVQVAAGEVPSTTGRRRRGPDRPAFEERLVRFRHTCSEAEGSEAGLPPRSWPSRRSLAGLTLVAGLAGHRLAQAEVTEPEKKAGERTIDMVVGALRFRVPAAYLPSFIQSDPAPVRHVPSFAFMFAMPGPVALTPEENVEPLFATQQTLNGQRRGSRRVVEVYWVSEPNPALPEAVQRYKNIVGHAPNLDIDVVLGDLRIRKTEREPVGVSQNGKRFSFISIASRRHDTSCVALLQWSETHFPFPLVDAEVSSPRKPFVLGVRMLQVDEPTFPIDIEAAELLASAWLSQDAGR